MTGEEQQEKLLSENEVDLIILYFPNELERGLNSFLCSSSSVNSMSNLSLANFIKESRVVNIVSPAKQIKQCLGLLKL